MLVRGGVAVAALLLLGMLWLVTARRLTELADAVATVHVVSLSPSPFGWNGTWLQFGPPIGEIRENFVGHLPGIDPQFRSLDLTGPGPLYGPAAHITLNAEGRLVLSGGGKNFVLGIRTGNHLPSVSGEPQMPEYAMEPGDRAWLNIERSLLAWPTLFELNVVGMGGTGTTWKRHVYYRLSLVKASGARLTMLWDGEQAYDPVNFWHAPGSFLVKVDFH